jgi:exodeoxyribonuclease V alpha subunit
MLFLMETETPELNPIDRHLSALLQRITPRSSRELAIAAQLLSNRVADGHICLPLRDVTPDMLVSAGIYEAQPGSSWAAKLRESALVGAEGDFKPLILDGAERLYFQRYWKYEDDVRRDLSARLATSPLPNQETLKQQFATLFSQISELQKFAVFVAATSNLCVISGSPGTGKTHTVVLICALLLSLSADAKIALAAPTGKAAARLKESLANARTKVPEEFATRLPNDASTIQRMLGARSESGKFRHNAENPLRVDAVIVDEASMIDLALLAKLLSAIPANARVILVGDKDQLASVEAGSAFRDICTPGFEIGISENQADAFAKCTGQKIANAVPRLAPIHDAIVELRENFRFSANQEIAKLSGAVNRGEAPSAIAIMKEGGQVSWRPTPSVKRFSRALRERVLSQFEKMLGTSDPSDALAQLGQFAVLCALRRGPFGAQTTNVTIEKMLREEGTIDRATKYYHGQPLIILRNDYNVELFNGDLGVVLKTSGGVRAFFPSENGEPRSFSTARLPTHETAFALTVHKSQGSEFEECLVILPDRDSPVLTRELLYTAVTRVRERVEIWASESVISQTISRQVQRSSGLGDALWHGRCS